MFSYSGKEWKAILIMRRGIRLLFEEPDVY